MSRTSACTSSTWRGRASVKIEVYFEVSSCLHYGWLIIYSCWFKNHLILSLHSFAPYWFFLNILVVLLTYVPSLLTTWFLCGVTLSSDSCVLINICKWKEIYIFRKSRPIVQLVLRTYGPYILSGSISPWWRLKLARALPNGIRGKCTGCALGCIVFGFILPLEEPNGLQNKLTFFSNFIMWN